MAGRPPLNSRPPLWRGTKTATWSPHRVTCRPLPSHDDPLGGSLWAGPAGGRRPQPPPSPIAAPQGFSGSGDSEGYAARTQDSRSNQGRAGALRNRRPPPLTPPPQEVPLVGAHRALSWSHLTCGRASPPRSPAQSSKSTTLRRDSPSRPPRVLIRPPTASVVLVTHATQNVPPSSAPPGAVAFSVCWPTRSPSTHFPVLGAAHPPLHTRF